MATVAVKERPILFSGEMVRAILDGRKTQTRRIVKPQPTLIYRLQGDRIQVDGTFPLSVKGCIYEAYDIEIRRCADGDPSFAQRRLHGGQRWTSLFPNEVRRLWSEGARGVVSARWAQDQEGISLDYFVPQQPQGDDECSSLGVHGIPRRASGGDDAGEALGRQPREQFSDESSVGNTAGELDGSRCARTRKQRREAPDGKTYKRRTRTHSLGSGEWGMQSEACGASIGDVASGDFKRMPWEVGSRLWVRETMHAVFDTKLLPDERMPIASYSADGSHAWSKNRFRVPWQWERKSLPSIHMPRRLSRITLEITEVRVERLQEISRDDSFREGVEHVNPYETHPELPNGMPACFRNYQDGGWFAADPIASFRSLWKSINGPDSWNANPWVWAITFRKI